jgi:hypothetical protein
MSTINTGPFRQLMHEVKYGHTTEDEAAARIDAHVELEVERALRKHGIEPTPTPNAEQRLMRDLGCTPGAIRPGVGEAPPLKERRRYLDGGME